MIGAVYMNRPRDKHATADERRPVYSWNGIADDRDLSNSICMHEAESYRRGLPRPLLSTTYEISKIDR
jgi:hypothetical protein